MARASTASLVISVLEQQGFRCLLPSQGTAALNLLMRRRSAQAVVVAVDWSKFRQTYPVGEEPALLANLAVHLGPLPAHHSEKPGTASKNNVREQLLALDSGPARRALLENHLKSLLAAVLKLQPSEIDEHKTMGAHGLDSLMGFEMRRRSEQSLGLKLSGTMVWNYPTIAALTEHLAGKLEISLADSAADGSPSASVKPAPIVPERANAVVSTVTTLSDDEALQALLGRGSS
jgi:acyl carrier protein